MEIMLHSPQGLRQVINNSLSRLVEKPPGDTYVLWGPHKAKSLGTEHLLPFILNISKSIIHNKNFFKKSVYYAHYQTTDK